MPLHDWSRVRHGMFHHFHNSWIYKLADQLNAGALPQGFYAAGEQIPSRIEPDVVTLEQSAAAQWDHSSALGVAEHPPKAAVHQESEVDAWLRKQDTLAIRRVGDDRLVAVIEIVSPANKSSRQRLAYLIAVLDRLTANGIHILVVDVLPPGQYDPAGLEAVVWDRAISGVSLPLIAPEQAVIGFCTGVGGKPLPDWPLYLGHDCYVTVPLEASYAAAWEHYPVPWKSQVATGT
jgi:hypothetical protein